MYNKNDMSAIRSEHIIENLMIILRSYLFVLCF